MAYTKVVQRFEGLGLSLATRPTPYMGNDRARHIESMLAQCWASVEDDEQTVSQTGSMCAHPSKHKILTQCWHNTGPAS